MGVKINQMQMAFDARSVNESFARMAVMAFMTDMNPTMDQLQDVKTAVSEAVTNAIIHGYGEPELEEVLYEHKEFPQIFLSCYREGDKLLVLIEDHGVGIYDVEEAKQPFYTTKPDKDRSGMGFAFMEAFMDSMEVESAPGVGTKVSLTKYIVRECDK